MGRNAYPYGVSDVRRKELEEYLEAQRARREGQDTPEYRQSLAEDREAEANSAQRNNFAAVLSNATASIGKSGDGSSMRRYADSANATNKSFYADGRQEDADREKMYGVNADVYKYLADKEGKAEDTARSSVQHSEKLEADRTKHKEDLDMQQKRLDQAASAQKEERERRDRLDRDKNTLDRDRLDFDKSKEKGLGPAKQEKNRFDAISQDKKDQIGSYSKDVATRSSIANMLESELRTFQNASTDDERIKVGEMALKTLNGALGKDAIGVEEAQRIGSALKFQMFNIRGAGPMFGRDFALFERQIAAKLKSMREGANMDRTEIDKLYARDPTKYDVNVSELKLQDVRVMMRQLSPSEKEKIKQLLGLD